MSLNRDFQDLNDYNRTAPADRLIFMIPMIHPNYD